MGMISFSTVTQDTHYDFALAATVIPIFLLNSKLRYHLAATFDGKKIHIYVNGDEVGKRAQLGDSIDTADLVIHIGNSPNRQRQFQGVLDEIRIFSLALTKGDIVWHMERGSFEVFPVTLNGKVTTT